MRSQVVGSSRFWGEKEVAGRRVRERERERDHFLACSKTERQHKGKRSRGRGQNGMRLKSERQVELIEKKESKALEMGR